MALRKGESGLVNRQAFLNSVSNDIHQLNSDLRFYESELADREIIVRDYLKQKQFKRAYILWLDKRMWKLRIRQAKKAKRALCKISNRASNWL